MFDGDFQLLSGEYWSMLAQGQTQGSMLKSAPTKP
jgi:hypothetical protein